MDMKKNPHADYKYWLYAPEGDGMTYYRTREDRDKAGEDAIAVYLDADGWSEDVEYVAAGEVTHVAQCVDRKERPTNLDADGCDEEGIYWGDCESMGNYTLEPPASDAALEEKKPITAEDQKAEFEAITRPVIEWMNANFNPHVTVVIGPTSAVLSEGAIAYTTHDYLRD